MWLTSLTGERYKVISDHAAGRTALFDLKVDPGELHDLSRERPQVLRSLARALEAVDAGLVAGGRSGARRRLQGGEVRQLKDLGYLQ